MFERFRKSKAADSAEKPVNLDQIISLFGQAAHTWQSQPIFSELIRARLADLCRDSQIRPVSKAQFAVAWQPFDDSHQRRFAILLAAGGNDPVLARFTQWSDKAESDPADGGNPILKLFHALTTSLPLLTVELITESDVRLEELARHFCQQAGLAIEKESPEKSAERLREIDFGRLIQEADEARLSAEDRMAYLRKLQEEQEATRRPRRGKW